MLPASARRLQGTRPPRCRCGARGVALVTTLLLLTLLTAITLAMVLAVSSDTLINGYYQNFRGSFYAADSGLNIARQAMVNQIVAAVPATFSATASPIPAGTDSAVRTATLSAYGSNTPVNLGRAASSWPGSFRITGLSLTLSTNCSPSPCTPPPYTAIVTDATGKVTGYQYIYNYMLQSEGHSNSGEQMKLADEGSLVINTSLTAAGGVTASFAAWGMFIDQYAICSGSYLVPGTITGPVFTNGAWTFGTAGSYLFTDPVGSVSSVAGYQFTGACVQSATSPVKRGNVTIAPVFQAGFSEGQPSIPLPPNDYNQERAVLDGIGTGSSPVTKNDLNSAVRDINGNPYPNSGATSGVWLPYTVDAVTGATTFTGGGIYVEGDSQVTLSASGSSAEVWTFKQGLTTTTVTVDPSSNTTTIVSGGISKTISGVPTQKDPSTGALVRNATMLYVNGNITSLSGPHDGSGNSLPAIQDGQAITITAARNMTVTGDLLYKTQPVTKTQNQIPGTPADTLIPGNDNGQVLGLFTATGDIQMQNAQSNGNLEIDASIATLSQGGLGGLINTGAAINTLTIVGGRIQNKIKNINSRTRNVFFDRRFAMGGFSPPWFPSTTLTLSGVVSATVSSSVQRVKWLDCTAINQLSPSCQ
ncbi:MAG: hypothetical protein HY237_08125 [Acidobacteria bacterium]|nr:hypothetical protein [Acidobacteriota bacterium]